jgi:hypothetical protein
VQAVGGEAVNEVYRSGCPINLSLEVFGDKWSLLTGMLSKRHDATTNRK